MKKLNVLQFICSSGFYGAEMWILTLAKYLTPEKVRCQLAMTLESEHQNLELCHRFEQLGLKGHLLKMNSRFDLMGILRLIHLIRREKIDIIHTHGYKSDIIGLMAARISGIRAITTPHGFENVKDIKLQMFIRMGCLALRFFDKVAPLSEELESNLCEMKISPDKIRLIINGVDLDEIEAERKKSPSLLFQDMDEKKIGYVGQMAYRKNVGDMIRAFDLLYKYHKNIRLFLIGDGPMRSELETLAQSLPSSERIEFLGYRKDRLNIVKELDLFSMTSSLEGIPRCMMEAMSMGIPVAAFNIPGVSDLIIQEKTGLMAEFGNIAALKQCWERLLFNREFSAKIAQSGRQHVVRNYSARRMADEYLLLYRDLVGRPQ